MFAPPTKIKGLFKRILCRALFGLCVYVGGTQVAHVQQMPPSPKQQKQQALDELEKALKEAGSKRDALSQEVESLREEQDKLQQVLVDATTQNRSAQERLGVLEGRLALLKKDEAQLSDALEKQRSLFGELLGAAQSMGRQPPPAVLIAPEDALRAVRTSLLLEAVLPDLRLDLEAMTKDYDRLQSVRTDMVREVEEVGAQRLRVLEDQRRLNALIALRSQMRLEREAEVTSLDGKLKNFASEATNLRDLIQKFEAEEAKLSENLGENSLSLRLSEGSRLKAQTRFEELKGKLNYPVLGRVIKTFGTTEGSVGTERGLTFQTPFGATVQSPIDAWVVFAGPFRSYGHVLILNGGDGYHVLLAGLDKINVAPKQFLLSGEPLGVMASQGNGGITGSEKSSSPQDRAGPQLYVEFRKNGSAIDPTPWWSVHTAGR
jgi:murein hydrolase activator